MLDNLSPNGVARKHLQITNNKEMTEVKTNIQMKKTKTKTKTKKRENNI